MLQRFPNINTGTSILQALADWFGARTKDDDKRSIRATFQTSLAPDDMAFIDMQEKANSYEGSAGFRIDMLQRVNPGYFQERDISACLVRCLPSNAIFMNPVRKDTGRELVDHLGLLADMTLLIQAKDSPNTKESIRRTLERKRKATKKQIEDAVSQIRGAAKYFRDRKSIDITVAGKDVTLSTGQRRLIGLAIVKELFEDEAESYTATCKTLSEISDGGILMDYSSFEALTFYCTSGGDLERALDAIMIRTLETGWFPVKYAVTGGKFDWLDEAISDKFKHF